MAVSRKSLRAWLVGSPRICKTISTWSAIRLAYKTEFGRLGELYEEHDDRDKARREGDRGALRMVLDALTKGLQADAPRQYLDHVVVPKISVLHLL